MNHPRFLRPSVEVHHRTATNRSGKKVQLRHAHYKGFVKVDRKTRAWAYCESRNGTLVTICKALNWEDFMDTFEPDFHDVDAKWAQAISLRMRASH